MSDLLTVADMATILQANPGTIKVRSAHGDWPMHVDDTGRRWFTIEALAIAARALNRAVSLSAIPPRVLASADLAPLQALPDHLRTSDDELGWIAEYTAASVLGVNRQTLRNKQAAGLLISSIRTRPSKVRRGTEYHAGDVAKAVRTGDAIFLAPEPVFEDDEADDE